ncbi:MAG TPA: YcgL domain-containing protein [Gammaproteobacteria bacterium]|nr:YcgL domain-containing protein [Gammaproteobacteria bacterium]
MICEIYKSVKKEETYLYLKKPGGFELIPPALRKTLGSLEFVMALELGSKQKLARENVKTVMENINRQGFHLQIPPKTSSLLAVHNLKNRC